jgi:lipopolysaccharide transport system ATP-binding protein
MSNIAIKAENISKAYQLGEFSTGTLSRDVERWWALMRGKDDPFLKIGEANDRSVRGDSDIVWSLRDIDFEINQGDAVGIIGRNGAGKSTLLKILSRVTTPTTGSVKVKGRIASLLEVGTGFHPELTGKENIFLNGAILGMRKVEIKKHFDAIVDFSGVERYIDTPVKRYSSGMYVRLAFAVAAHLESEILIVDEVLAVGDAEFQKKCLGKMSDVSKGEGRTVLFVSHQIASIQKLCNKGMLLSNGGLKTHGNINDVINSYVDSRISFKYARERTEKDTVAFIKQAYTINKRFEEIDEFASGETWGGCILIDAFEDIEHFIVGVSLFNHFDVQLRTSWSKPIKLSKNSYYITFFEENIYFAPGSYFCDVSISSYHKDIEYLKGAISFQINDVSHLEENSRTINLNLGIINNQMNFNINADVKKSVL